MDTDPTNTEPENTDLTHSDAIVVGGSYAGLSAALQLARARRRVTVVDAGRRRNAPSHAAHGFLSRDGEAPDAIVRVARAQLLAYPTARAIAGEATRAASAPGGFRLTLADGRALGARRLVLATGVRDELPAIPGLAERWGTSVVLCPYCHAYESGGRPLGVIGLHPLSLHQAALLPDWGPTTYFTQGAFEPDEEHAALFRARGVAVERTPVAELLGPSPRLDAVRLADGRTVGLDLLLIATRTSAASPLAEQLGCAFEEGMTGPYVRTDEWKQTSVPGVFAAGDAAAPLHVISLASASGTMAGVAAHNTLAMGLPG